MKATLKSQLVFCTALLISVSARASFSDYYMVDDPTSSRRNLQDANNLDPLETWNATLRASSSQIFSLLNWDHHTESFADPDVPYNRKEQYGTWIVDSRNGCVNTRGRVLENQSQIPVTFNSRGCTVVSGRWLDPYTNQEYTQASDMQIDHVVPLKNSYISGGWKWNSDKKCLYANFMVNDFHLLAVDGHENMKKGDGTPAVYMPPNQGFSCQYLTIWLKIKLIWNLAMSPQEAKAISSLAQQNHCDISSMTMDSRELLRQRSGIMGNIGFCRAATENSNNNNN